MILLIILSTFHIVNDVYVVIINSGAQMYLLIILKLMRLRHNNNFQTFICIINVYI